MAQPLASGRNVQDPPQTATATVPTTCTKGLTTGHHTFALEDNLRYKYIELKTLVMLLAVDWWRTCLRAKPCSSTNAGCSIGAATLAFTRRFPATRKVLSLGAAKALPEPALHPCCLCATNILSKFAAIPLVNAANYYCFNTYASGTYVQRP
jgi:hypothetical protein